MPEEGRFAFLYDIIFGYLLDGIEKNIVEIASKYRCDKIADMGCGTGKQIYLLKKGGYAAIGIDKSILMIRAAKRKNINCILGDIASTPFPSHYFDCLIYSFVLHPNTREVIEKILEEGKRVIKEDGIFIITDYGIPKRRRAAIAIKMIERFATKEHYLNYEEFMKRGAIEWIIQKLGKAKERKSFYNGGVETVVI